MQDATPAHIELLGGLHSPFSVRSFVDPHATAVRVSVLGLFRTLYRRPPSPRPVLLPTLIQITFTS